MTNIVKMPKTIKYDRGNSLGALRRSHFYGYWLRLKTLGFRFVSTKITHNAQNNLVYLTTHWRFKRDDETVIISTSRRKQRLRIKLGGQTVLNTSSVNGADLENPFLEYFGEQKKPLFIHRLGRRSKRVQRWEQHWLQHMKENKKWTKRLKELGIFQTAMPVQTHKPRPRAYKPRGGK